MSNVRPSTCSVNVTKQKYIINCAKNFANDISVVNIFAIIFTKMEKLPNKLNKILYAYKIPTKLFIFYQLNL